MHILLKSADLAAQAQHSTLSLLLLFLSDLRHNENVMREVECDVSLSTKNSGLTLTQQQW